MTIFVDLPTTFTIMPSFDIVSKVDQQILDNAINITKKEITNRFDFKDSPVKIELNKKDMKIALEADSEMKIKQITDVLDLPVHETRPGSAGI